MDRDDSIQLNEAFYSSHQVNIPPILPPMLKNYAKAAIRTQPQDLLLWSVSYFKALKYNVPLPIKERFEYPPVQTIAGLTPGFLKVLINQVGNNFIKLPKKEIIEFWSGICLDLNSLDEIFAIGGFKQEINWLKFIAICAGRLETSLTRTMILLCRLLSEEPPGGSAFLPLNKFMYLYKYLARLDCGPEEPLGHKILDKSKTPKSLTDMDEVLTGEEAMYKEGSDSIKSITEVSWESILNNLGKRQSDVSASTIDPDKEKEDVLSRGIAWKKVLEIERSEPDSSNPRTPSDLGDSTLGLQVFEYTDENTKSKIQRQRLAREISRDSSAMDVGQNLEPSEIKEMDKLLKDFDMAASIKETVQQLEGAVDETVDTSKQSNIEEPEPYDEIDTIKPERFEVTIPCEHFTYNIHELVEVDSSTILVPSPPPRSESGESMEYIEPLREVDDGSSQDLEETASQIRFRLKTVSLHDVRIPQIDLPELKQPNEKDIPMELIHEKIWIYIPGIGPRVPEIHILKVLEFMKSCAENQGGTVMPRNLRHMICPPMDPNEVHISKGGNTKGIL